MPVGRDKYFYYIDKSNASRTNLKKEINAFGYVINVEWKDANTIQWNYDMDADKLNTDLFKSKRIFLFLDPLKKTKDFKHSTLYKTMPLNILKNNGKGRFYFGNAMLEYMLTYNKWNGDKSITLPKAETTVNNNALLVRYNLKLSSFWTSEIDYKSRRRSNRLLKRSPEQAMSDSPDSPRMSPAAPNNIKKKRPRRSKRVFNFI